jgi:hypothetical protein
VSDGSFGNVQIFDSSGRLLMSIGSLARQPEPGFFPLIAGVAVDNAGFLYVVDHFFKKIDVFKRLSDEEGRERMRTGG